MTRLDLYVLGWKYNVQSWAWIERMREARLHGDVGYARTCLEHARRYRRSQWSCFAIAREMP